MPINSPISASGTLRFDWIDPQGNVRDLTRDTSPSLFVTKGAVGLGMIETEIADDKLPFAPGSLVRHVSVPPRRIELPIYASDDSLGDLSLVLDALRLWFRTGNERDRAPGALRITRPDASVRQIAAYYAGGLGGDLANVFLGSGQAVISLYCPDPYPTGPDEVTRTWTYPFDLFPDTQVEINEGEVEAFPIWTFTSATATTLGIGSATTNESFAIDTSPIFPGADSLTVDTRLPSFRDNPQIYDSDDENQYRWLNRSSDLFWLQPGSNVLQFQANGIADGDTIELRYLPRYLGLLG